MRPWRPAFKDTSYNRRIGNLIRTRPGKFTPKPRAPSRDEAFRATKLSDVAAIDDTSEICIPNPHLGDAVNRKIIQSEIEGGVFLREIPIAGKLEVQTKNHSYTLVNQGDGEVLINGHPDICPEPVLVRVNGSNWGGSMLKADFLGRGMHMEFKHPAYKGVVVTSRIVELRQVQ